MKRRISLFPPVEIPSILAPFTEQLLGGSGCELQSWAVSAKKVSTPPRLWDFRSVSPNSVSQSSPLETGSNTSTCFLGLPWGFREDSEAHRAQDTMNGSHRFSTNCGGHCQCALNSHQPIGALAWVPSSARARLLTLSLPCGLLL